MARLLMLVWHNNPHGKPAMPLDQTSTFESGTKASSGWCRRQVADLVLQFESGNSSQRAFAQNAGVPRSTLQHWLKRKKKLDADPALVAFFESPTGLAFLHRLVGACHLTFIQQGTCGIRLVGEFLHRTGLNRFVASSYGSQQAIARQLEQTMVDYDASQRRHLASRMTPRPITVCEDETFHPQVCLVSIEPVSDFILLEVYCQGRDATSWTIHLTTALEGVPVEVVQVTSDEAKGLLAHARDGLGVHHSPDLFHVQHEVSKATSLALRSQTNHAQADLDGARQQTQQWIERRDAFPQGPRRPGRPPDFERHIEESRDVEQTMTARLEAAQQRQQLMRQAIRGLGDDDHPFDLTSGRPCDADAVRQHLTARFAAIERIADQADLAIKARERIAKARRVLEAMVATIAWVWVVIRRRVDSLRLSPPLQQVLVEQLIAGLYLVRVAAKARSPAERAAITRVADGLLIQARAPNGSLGSLPAEQREVIEREASWCADLFQGSSSCVEGRNGQLALRHHHLHQLCPRKLKVLTILHNYLIRRPDGTTAAGRFFGVEPQDLFEYVLDRLDVPARPAAPRPTRERSAA
jgi:uncharacterized protein DUF6399